MERTRVPTEFGFTTPSYLPPERERPLWRTLLFGALLALIPFAGPGISAVYIDRRRMPGTFDIGAAFGTALIQLAAVALLVVVLWLVFGLFFGITFEVSPRLTGPGPAG